MEQSIQQMKLWIAPSLLAANFSHLGRDIQAATQAGADALHFDVMDGHFVPNITFGPLVVRAVREMTRLPFLVHLMIEHPERFIDEFARAGADYISVHVEACPHLHRTIQQIHAAGARAGVALNPSTSVSTLEHIVSEIECVLIMTVNPGFGGQKFIERMVPKIKAARKMAGPKIDIEVDGGIDAKTAPKVVAAGANVLVAGTAVFNGDAEVAAAVRNLRDAATAGSSGACGL